VRNRMAGAGAVVCWLGFWAPVAMGAAFTPIESLERCSAAQDGNDDASVSRLVDAVLSFPHAFEIPAAARLSVAVRLHEAQKAYLLSRARGVLEDDVVSVVNDLATSLRLPAFAQVSARQVRAVRMKLVQDNPGFMGRGLLAAHALTGTSVNPYMSPAQALHLILTIADQKLLNEEYQVEPTQWEADHQAPRPGDGAPVSPAASGFAARASASPRLAELRRSANDRLRSMTLGEISDLADRSLTKLGM
jgi:hypothetical protein